MHVRRLVGEAGGAARRTRHARVTLFRLAARSRRNRNVDVCPSEGAIYSVRFVQCVHLVRVRVCSVRTRLLRHAFEERALLRE